MSGSQARTVEGTVVFTDIVGFTAFTAAEGDERAFDLLGVQGDAVAAVLTDGARVVKELGDGLMLWFPDATAALRAVLGLQSRLSEQTDDTFPLWIRAGAHAGSQRCRGDDLVGHDVNVAARIVDRAGPGELLVSDATVRACDGASGVRFEEVGPTLVKGIPEPVWLHRVDAT